MQAQGRGCSQGQSPVDGALAASCDKAKGQAGSSGRQLAPAGPQHRVLVKLGLGSKRGVGQVQSGFGVTTSAAATPSGKDMFWPLS